MKGATHYQATPYHSPSMTRRIISPRKPQPKPIIVPATISSTKKPTPIPIRRPAGIATPVTPDFRFFGCSGCVDITTSYANSSGYFFEYSETNHIKPLPIRRKPTPARNIQNQLVFPCFYLLPYRCASIPPEKYAVNITCINSTTALTGYPRWSIIPKQVIL